MASDNKQHQKSGQPLTADQMLSLTSSTIPWPLRNHSYFTFTKKYFPSYFNVEHRKQCSAMKASPQNKWETQISVFVQISARKLKLGSLDGIFVYGIQWYCLCGNMWDIEGWDCLLVTTITFDKVNNLSGALHNSENPTHWEITYLPTRQPSGTRNHEAAGWVLPGPRGLPNWELCDLTMGMGSCFHPMTHENGSHWVFWNHAVPTTFLHWFWHWSWDNIYQFICHYNFTTLQWSSGYCEFIVMSIFRTHRTVLG